MFTGLVSTINFNNFTVNASESLYHSQDFQNSTDFPTTTNYQSNRTNIGPTNFKWDFLPGTISTTNAITSPSVHLRGYSANQSPKFETVFSVPNITKVTFNYKSDANISLLLSYSIDNRVNWSSTTSFTRQANTTAATYTLNASGISGNAHLRWQMVNSGTSTGASAELIVDDIQFFNFDSKTLSSIAVTTPPTETTYFEGDSFDPTGMVITATYDDNTTEIINNNSLSITPNPLTIGTTEVTVSYTEGDTTRTTTVGDLTVSARSASTGTTVTLVPSNMIVGGGTSQATATPTPPEAAPTYAWSSSNEAVATVHPTTGVVTPVSAGTANIIATPNDGGEAGQATLTVRGASTTLLISAVYGAGGNTGATYNKDFVQLYNMTNNPISLNNYSIQYASSTGTSWSSKVSLSDVSILAKGFYLIHLSGGANGNDLTTSDQIGSITMAAIAGKVALVNSTNQLSNEANPVNNLTVVDFVGYGSGTNGFEGNGPAPAPSATTFIRRTTLNQESNNNATDFEAIEFTGLTINNSSIGFAQDFIAKTSDKLGLCNANDLQWSYLSTNFNALSSDAKAEFNTSSQADIALARSRYQYLRGFNPNGLESFGTPLNSRFLETVPLQDFNLLNILIMVIMTSLGVLFVKKRFSTR